jgi:hypothetical protein
LVGSSSPPGSTHAVPRKQGFCGVVQIGPNGWVFVRGLCLCGRVPNWPAPVILMRRCLAAGAAARPGAVPAAVNLTAPLPVAFVGLLKKLQGINDRLDYTEGEGNTDPCPGKRELPNGRASLNLVSHNLSPCCSHAPVGSPMASTAAWPLIASCSGRMWKR